MRFSDRLKELRKELGLSQRTLAENLDISSTSIHFYELGDKLPSIEVLYKMVGYFNVSADYLIGISNDPKGNISEDTRNKIDALEKLEEENKTLKNVISAIRNTIEEIDC